MSKLVNCKVSVILLLLLFMLMMAVGLAQGADSDGDLSPEQLQAEVEIRQSLGFRSNIDYIMSVHRSDQAVIAAEFGNVPLTPAEAQELRTRIDLEKDGDTLQAFFAQNEAVAEAYAGLYVDHAAGSEDHTVGGHLVLLIARDHISANDISGMLPRLRHQQRLHMELVDYTYEHLQQQYQAISQAASNHPDLRAISINDKLNRIDVLIAPSGDWRINADSIVDKGSLPAALQNLLTDPSIVVQIGEVSRTPTAVVDGGDSWSGTSGGANCTLGFKVRYNSIYSMLSAGHCIDDLTSGQNVYHGTTQIGTNSGAWTFGANSSSGIGIDAGILYMNSQSTASDDLIEYTYLVDVHGSTSTYVAGYWRCWTGRVSGTKCGTIECTSTSYYDGGVNRWFTNVATFDPVSVLGDSGGPAFRPDAGATASVTGIQAAAVSGLSCTNGNDAEISKWDDIRTYFGNVTLVTDG